MKAFIAVREYLAAQGMARALRHRDFRLFVTTHWVSAVGMWVQRIGVGWLTWELTHSGAWLGFVAAAEAVPAFVLLPFAGAVADRFDRLRVFRGLIIVNTSLAALLALLTLADAIDAYLLVSIIAANAVVHSMSMPARMTMAPGLVPREDVPAAIGLSSILFQISAFVGPALAGIVISLHGVGYAFVCNALSYVLYIVALFSIRLAYEQTGPRHGSTLLSDVWTGVRYVVDHASIGPLMALVMAAVVFTRSFVDLLPGFADEIFGRGADGLAMLVAAGGVGGIAAGLWIAHYGQVRRMTSIVMVAILVSATVLIVFASTHAFWLAVACVAVISATATITNTGSEMLVQHAVDGALRGRVMSIFGLTWRGLPGLGALALGGASSLFGLQAPVLGAGLLCLAVWAVTIRRRSALAARLEGAGP